MTQNEDTEKTLVDSLSFSHLHAKTQSKYLITHNNNTTSLFVFFFLSFLSLFSKLQTIQNPKCTHVNPNGEQTLHIYRTCFFLYVHSSSCSFSSSNRIRYPSNLFSNHPPNKLPTFFSPSHTVKLQTPN